MGLGAEAIIQLAVVGLTQATKAITLAQEGDLNAAIAELAKSRDHFASSLSDWDAAPGPTSS